jgi:hypothetical protein
MIFIEDLIWALRYDFTDKTSFEVTIKVKLELRDWEVLLFPLFFRTIIGSFKYSGTSRGYSHLISLTIIDIVNSDSF